MDEFRIKSLHLKDTGPYLNFKLNFKDGPGLNIICGENGVGKTTILESIVSAFYQGRNHKIKRRQPAESGQVTLDYRENHLSQKTVIQLKTFDPSQPEFIMSAHQYSRYIVNIGAHRDFAYHKQETIQRDPDFDIIRHSAQLPNGINPNDIKSWFTNRYLLKHHANESSWTPQMHANLESAVSFFSLLDPKVKLDQVNVRTFDILVSTPSGTIPYEYMSSGFRSAYIMLLGILRELEYRRLDVSAKEFSGVILIDELDIHLHPSWQKEIGTILKNAFPNAQIIATTHSPHIIQAAQAEEVIALSRNQDGVVEVRKLLSSKYGYAGWTVEEVLEDIMGVQDTRTSVFRDAMLAFDKAIDARNAKEVRDSLTVLKEMLHPNNALGKLLEIQAAPYMFDDLEGEDSD